MRTLAFSANLDLFQETNLTYFECLEVALVAKQYAEKHKPQFLSLGYLTDPDTSVIPESIAEIKPNHRVTMSLTCSNHGCCTLHLPRFASKPFDERKTALRSLLESPVVAPELSSLECRCRINAGSRTRHYYGAFSQGCNTS